MGCSPSLSNVAANPAQPGDVDTSGGWMIGPSQGKTTRSASVLKTLSQSQRLMASGLLFSVFAGSVGQGVIPGAVAAGGLAVVWVAVIGTAETVEDLSSANVGRLLERRDPGRVLVSAETFSLACAAIALLVVLAGAPAFEAFLLAVERPLPHQASPR